MNRLPSTAAMHNAFAKKDSSFDGIFFVAVKTTGVFCRPVCRAKRPRPENVEFFPTAQDAMYHGYRPCKLCRPMDSAGKPPATVTRLIEMIEHDPARRLRERDLREIGIDPSTARRQFRAHCGTTFASYQRARRMGLALRDVRNGTNLTSVQIGAGFESGSGFREAFTKMFGTPASRASGVVTLAAKWLRTPLGPMLAVACDDGVVLFEFVDRKGLEREIERIRRRFGTRGRPAIIVPEENRHLKALAVQIEEHFAGRRRAFTVPLMPVGSDFERRAWDYLRSIPFGQTRSYQDEARAIGSPKAVRAVGRANGMNGIAIVIPCHRVIGANGDLTGYGGGLARKRWLIDHEQKVLAGSVASANELVTSPG